jgi:hypothetical protein
LNIQSIDIRWEKLPHKLSVDELKNGPNSYSLPQKSAAVYWPPPYKSPAPIIVRNEGGSDDFSVQIDTSSLKPGLYYVMIWAKPKQGGDPIVASCRTVPVQ